MFGTLEMKSGFLCIAVTQSDWTEPRLITQYFPIGPESDPGLHPIGERVQSTRNTDLSTWFWIGNGHSRTYTLDEKAQSIAVEFTPVKKPRGKGPFKWDCGEWKRVY